MQCYCRTLLRISYWHQQNVSCNTHCFAQQCMLLCCRTIHDTLHLGNGWCCIQTVPSHCDIHLLCLQQQPREVLVDGIHWLVSQLDCMGKIFNALSFIQNNPAQVSYEQTLYLKKRRPSMNERTWADYQLK